MYKNLFMKYCLCTQEFDRVWSVIDQNKDGVLDYGEFLRSFVGSMSEERKYWVRKVSISGRCIGVCHW